MTAVAQPTTTDLQLAKELGMELEKCRNDRVQDRADSGKRCKVMLDATRDRSAVLLRECDEMAAVNHKLLSDKLEATEAARVGAELAAERHWWEDPIMIGSITLATGIALGIAGTATLVAVVK